MKSVFFFLACLFLLPLSLSSQERVEWSPEIIIDTTSFQAELPELTPDNVQQYTFFCSYDFGYQMANIQFALTKNFNKYVSAFYMPSHSWIEEGTSTKQLIGMANLEFDLVELYARKFREDLYANKKFGSNSNFFHASHERINLEYVNYRAQLESELRVADNWFPIIDKYSKEVNAEIEALADYCKECKPPKKKRKKNK